jgi:limonene-1,2-epoxide hydrolase
LREVIYVREGNIALVERHFEALRRHDLSLSPLADDVYFDDPIAGRDRSADNFRAFLSGFLPAISGVRVLRHVCEGEYVATHWEADTIFGIIPILELFRIEDEKITEIIAYFDPRPIVGSK